MTTETQLKHLEAENTGLRSQLQIQVLELEEYRRVLLALVVAVEQRYAWIGPDIEIRLQDAREVLAKAGLL